ncbi:hypothetical protein [Sphingobium ummariense]|uniref:Uncharacterized protein n=1 Tax=Sphingobium ummariense RL-3 TaxID=1346791 RepID=T0K346_9SPHN|nr:hypothetical protein [Sphingobium ummariense]EQB31004.1 hypothetical protein M529_16955 [Sphingobium ummariense RL-3]
MKTIKAALVAGLFLSAYPALAEDKPKLNRNDPNAVRCRQLEVTGSLVRKERICKTNAEWRAISEQQNRDADDIISRNRAGMNPNG